MARTNKENRLRIFTRCAVLYLVDLYYRKTQVSSRRTVPDQDDPYTTAVLRQLLDEITADDIQRNLRKDISDDYS